ncbi:MAG: putative LuxA, partial [uncultured Acetobacteraceae bacterium]
GLRPVQPDGLPRAGHAGAPPVRRSRGAGAGGGGGGVQRLLVRRAPLLQLLRLPLAFDDGGAPGGRDDAHPLGQRRGGGAALPPGAADLGDRHGGRHDARALGARRGQRLPALRVRALRRRLGGRAGEAAGVHGDARPRLRGRDLPLRGAPPPDAGDAHRAAAGGRHARGVGGGRQPGPAPDGGAAGLRGDGDAAPLHPRHAGSRSPPLGGHLPGGGRGAVAAALRRAAARLRHRQPGGGGGVPGRRAPPDQAFAEPAPARAGDAGRDAGGTALGWRDEPGGHGGAHARRRPGGDRRADGRGDPPRLALPLPAAVPGRRVEPRHGAALHRALRGGGAAVAGARDGAVGADRLGGGGL